MRVFLVQTARGLFSSSGGYKANIALLRHLASRGHAVRQLCYSFGDEVDTYVQKMAKRGGHDPHRRTRLLHLRTKNGRLEIDVKVEELVMDDGVQVVALQSEAFDDAFGGTENICRDMVKETADYIEVIAPPSSALLDPTCQMPGVSDFLLK
jgi:hypothetical protein